MKRIAKPADSEFQPNEPLYATLLPDDDLLLKHLQENIIHTKDFVSSLPKDKLNFRYSEGKWTIKEVLVHLMDMERIYAYRALRFARNDKTTLPGFDHQDYVCFSGIATRGISDILIEYEAVRNATVALLNGLTDEALLRFGSVNGNSVSVRALAYHIGGHELHHVNIIKERYLNT
jgi:hypothetical protein